MTQGEWVAGFVGFLLGIAGIVAILLIYAFAFRSHLRKRPMDGRTHHDDDPTPGEWDGP